MNKLIKEMTDKLVNQSAQDLKDSYLQIKELSDQINRKKQEIEYLISKDEAMRLKELLKEVLYVSPEYDYDNEESHKEGSCLFSSLIQAEELIKRQNKQIWSSVHKLEWNGIGKYIISIDTDYKCGDTIYIYHYRKENV